MQTKVQLRSMKLISIIKKIRLPNAPIRLFLVHLHEVHHSVWRSYPALTIQYSFEEKACPISPAYLVI